MSNQANASINLGVGDPAPWFHQRSTSSQNYAIDTAAGRYIVLCFYISAADDVGRSINESVSRNRDLFDDEKMCFFGVSMDPADESEARVRQSMPGIRHFWDFDGNISRKYGAIAFDSVAGSTLAARRFWLVLDPTMRIMARFPMTGKDADLQSLYAYLRKLPPVHLFAGFEIPAPILVLPNVFEAELCRELIATYEREGGMESGFMREVDGKTVLVTDHIHKRRKDCVVTDAVTVKAIQARIFRRVRPELQKVYSFDATRMERYIVGCYATEDEAHFRAHRDNTTKGTAHRRYAVSINLNGEFEGGEVSFPEYGSRSYKAPPGGAIIFPCALLHAVSKVVSGRRYAFLPFLYDDAAAKQREENSQYLEGGGGYKATWPTP